MSYSREEYPYTGGSQDFVADFALGVLDPSDVTVYVIGEVDGFGNQVHRAYTWLNPTTVRVTAPLPNPCTVVVQRTVDKNTLEIDLGDTGPPTRGTLVRAFKQVMMNIHELIDGRAEAFTGALLDAVEGVKEQCADAMNAARGYRDAAQTSQAAAGASATSAAGSASAASTSASAASGSAAAALAHKNAVDTAKAAVDTAKAAVDTAKGQVDTAKTAVDAAKVATESARDTAVTAKDTAVAAKDTAVAAAATMTKADTATARAGTDNTKYMTALGVSQRRTAFYAAGGDTTDLATGSANRQVRLSVDFVATSDLVVAQWSGGFAHSATSGTDVVVDFDLFDVTSNALVSSVSGGEVCANAHTFAARFNIPLAPGTLTVGRTYRLRAWIYKTVPVGPTYPREMSISGFCI